jgi:hypothetical protein
VIRKVKGKVIPGPKYHAMKMYLLLNNTLSHEDVLEEWRYSSMPA